MTEEGFRRKFFTSKPNNRETATQFVNRLANYFDRWVDLSKTTKTYEQLRLLLIREQYVGCVNMGMAAFLREGDLSNSELGQVAERFERYAEAHGLYEHIGQISTSDNNMGSEGRPKEKLSYVKPVGNCGRPSPNTFRNRSSLLL